MIRILNVHYQIRTLVLVSGEAILVCASFLLATLVQYREDSYLVLNFEYGYVRIIALTLFVILLCHWLDLYDPSRFGPPGEFYFRLLLVPGLLSLALGITEIVLPGQRASHPSFLWGVAILTVSLIAWRNVFLWLMTQPIFRERVYILGTGDRAQRLMHALRSRWDLGFDVAGWSGDSPDILNRDSIASHLWETAKSGRIDRIIVAMRDRRGTMPLQELLQLRLEGGIHIEEATTWLEKIDGKIEVEQLNPSWIIFSQGFRFGATFRALRRVLNLVISSFVLLIAAPIIPFIILAVKLDSRGPALYRQRRVGRAGAVFYCYKFRTMRQDAEADIGPTWACDDDPRITRVGKVLRMTRLDEIPQLWCVLKGDMAFVGPRPERPEFVEMLTQQIPYYGIRHLVRPGITGWAQIRYKYGNTIEDAKEKLQYDLFYIKNASVGLDLFVMFQTIKIVLLRRGQ